MADVEIHIDETLDAEGRRRIAEKLRQHAGVLGADSREETPHIVIVKYDPQRTDSLELLDVVQHEGLHGELFGL